MIVICKNCIHYDRCKGLYRFERLQKAASKGCPYFKDRFRFMELPCEIGDTVYVYANNRAEKATVKTFTIFNDQILVGTTIGVFDANEICESENEVYDRRKNHETKRTV